MEFKGRYFIPAAPQSVWRALNDPAVLEQCVPGCEALEKTDETHFKATAVLKIGPVKATFKANLALDDLDPPRRCTIKGEGQGGVAGFARGEAEVVLTPEADGTVLTYAAQANIGGKLAQIGQRLIDGAAKQIADDFFTRFSAAVAAAPTAGSVIDDAGPQPVDVPPATDEVVASSEGLAPAIWVVGLLAIITGLLVLFGIVDRR